MWCRVECNRRPLHYNVGKPPALPEDSRSSTIPGLVRFAGWGFAQFPLTPALSLGERVKSAPPAEQSTRLGFPRRNAGCSLSPRETVRGNKPPRCSCRISSFRRANMGRRSLTVRTRKRRTVIPVRRGEFEEEGNYFSSAWWNSYQSSRLLRSTAPGLTEPSSGIPLALRMPLRVSSSWI